MSLTERGLDIHRFIRNLEQVLIDLLRDYGIDSSRIDGHPGVWVIQKKIASIGLAVSRWVTYHGFALNVNTDLEYFKLIRPCGLDPETITSMAQVKGVALEMSEVKIKLKEHFTQVFDIDGLHSADPTSMEYTLCSHSATG